FEMARRQVDDQPPDLALAHRVQLGGEDFEVPVRRQLGLRVELLKAASGEGGKVIPQQDLVLGRGKLFHCSDFFTEKRARSCSRTFSSASLKAEVSAAAGSVSASMSRSRSRRILTARKSALAARLTS